MELLTHKKEKWVYYLSIVIILSVCIIPQSSAHKDAAETSQEAGEYRISFGFNPANPYIYNKQEVYLLVQDAETGEYINDVDVTFMVSRLQWDDDEQVEEQLNEYDGVRSSAGRYTATHRFTEIGGYRMVAHAKRSTRPITSVQKDIHVEPIQPSPIFFTYMAVALLVAMAISRKGDKIK